MPAVAPAGMGRPAQPLVGRPRPASCPACRPACHTRMRERWQPMPFTRASERPTRCLPCPPGPCPEATPEFPAAQRLNCKLKVPAPPLPSFRQPAARSALPSTEIGSSQAGRRSPQSLPVQLAALQLPFFSFRHLQNAACLGSRPVHHGRLTAHSVQPLAGSSGMVKIGGSFFSCHLGTPTTPFSKQAGTVGEEGQLLRLVCS